MSEWQPIETAPRDGTEIIVGTKSHLGTKGTVTSAWFHEDTGTWACSVDNDGEPNARPAKKPTHWMPLPEPPK